MKPLLVAQSILLHASPAPNDRCADRSNQGVSRIRLGGVSLTARGRPMPVIAVPTPRDALLSRIPPRREAVSSPARIQSLRQFRHARMKISAGKTAASAPLCTLQQEDRMPLVSAVAMLSRRSAAILRKYAGITQPGIASGDSTCSVFRLLPWIAFAPSGMGNTLILLFRLHDAPPAPSKHLTRNHRVQASLRNPGAAPLGRVAIGCAQALGQV